MRYGCCPVKKLRATTTMTLEERARSPNGPRCVGSICLYISRPRDSLREMLASDLAVTRYSGRWCGRYRNSGRECGPNTETRTHVGVLSVLTRNAGR